MKRAALTALLAVVSPLVLANGNNLIVPPSHAATVTPPPAAKPYAKTATQVSTKAAISAAKPAPIRHYINYKTVQFYPGSLKANLIHAANKFGWRRVIWTADNDYRWVSYNKIKTASIQSLFRTILVEYPLQAEFYQGSHVVVIKSRTLK